MSLCIMMMAMLLAGCHRAQRPSEPKVLNHTQWQELKEANRRRLIGESATRSERGIGKQVWDVLVTAPVRQVKFWLGDKPTIAAHNLEDPNSPDNRRQGIFWLVDRNYGRNAPYTRRFEQISVGDEDYTVRAAALRALNRSRDTRAIDMFLTQLEDPNDLVRLEAAKGLANVPDPRAITPLVKHLSNEQESKDVRIAAADALRNFPTSEVAQALIRVLQDRDFGVSWQARYSLRLMTGHDYKYDQSAWLGYLTTERTPFS